MIIFFGLGTLVLDLHKQYILLLNSNRLTLKSLLVLFEDNGSKRCIFSLKKLPNSNISNSFNHQCAGCLVSSWKQNTQLSLVLEGLLLGVLTVCNMMRILAVNLKLKKSCLNTECNLRTTIIMKPFGNNNIF